MLLYSRVALLFSLVVLLQGQTPDPCSLCICNRRDSDNGLIVDCNGRVNGLTVSIGEVMNGFRTTNMAGSILEL